MVVESTGKEDEFITPHKVVDGDVIATNLWPHYVRRQKTSSSTADKNNGHQTLSAMAAAMAAETHTRNRKNDGSTAGGLLHSASEVFFEGCDDLLNLRKTVQVLQKKE